MSYRRDENCVRAGAAFLMLSGACLALPLAHADPPMEELQVTATRQAQSTLDTAVAVTVLAGEALERDTPRVLPDLLRGQTGVYVQQTTAGQAVPIIRGLKGSEVLHLVDGMRLNNAFFRNAPSQYLALVDARNVARLEVVRGPSSTLYGSDAMGGVVQVITRVPQFDDEEWSWRGLVQAEFASAENLRAGRASIEAGHTGLAFSTGVSYADSGDRRSGGDGGTIRPSGYRSLAADAKLVIATSPDAELLLDLQYLQQPSTPRVDELVAGFGQDEPDSDLFLFEPNERMFAHARYRVHAPWPGVDSLEINFARQRVDDDRRSRGNGSRRERRENNRSVLDGLTLQAASSSDAMRYTWGAEWYHDEVDSSRVEFDLDTRTTEVVSSRFPDGSTMDSIALYLNAEWLLSDRTTLTTGARYSHFDINLAAADRGVGARLKPDDLTANVGMIFEMTPALRFVSNLGRGFRPPNIFDLGTLGERSGNRFNIASDDLGPETVLTLDAGIKFRTARWRGEFMLYQSDYRDKISSVATGDLSDDGRQIVQSQNVNELKLYGGEAGVRFDASDTVELSANLTWTRGEESSPDEPVQPADRVPPLNGRFGLLYRPQEKFWAEAFLRFADGQDRLSLRDVSDPRIDPEGTPGWGTLNLRMGWEQEPNLSFALSLNNLGDRRYREHGSGIDAPGFDAVLSVTARF